MEPNWYPDPSDSTLLRWWDGNQWTEHTHAAGGDNGAGQTPNHDQVAAAALQGAQEQMSTTALQGATAQAPQVQAAQSQSAQAHAAQGSGAGMPESIRSSSLFKDNQELETSGRFTSQNRAVAKVTGLATTPLLVRRGAMIAYQGDVNFAYESTGVKRKLKSMATNEGLKLMRCDGNGELFVSHGGEKLHFLTLGEGEGMSINSKSLLGFDATMHWDIEVIKAGAGAMMAGGLFNVKLTGPGTLILATDWPLVLDTSEAQTLVDPNAAVAWSAHLQVKMRSTMSAGALIGRGSGEAFQMEFSSGGFVIVEPEPILGVQG
ncbi:MAG: AIM24 family protein [Microthrixaceae bacterium]